MNLKLATSSVKIDAIEVPPFKLVPGKAMLLTVIVLVDV